MRNGMLILILPCLVWNLQMAGGFHNGGSSNCGRGETGGRSVDIVGRRTTGKCDDFCDELHQRQSAGLCHKNGISAGLVNFLQLFSQCVPALERFKFKHFPASTQLQNAPICDSDADAPDEVVLPRGKHNIARHEVTAPRKGDEMSEARALALEAALHDLGVDIAALRSEAFCGSPAQRAYFSFINPRNKVKLRASVRETPEQAARRSAAQIAFLERAHRLEAAEYVRNSDHSKHLSHTVRSPLILVLDNLRSVYNVGSILRTAETAACELVVTCGITPHPPHDKLRKTAFSAADEVPTRHFSSVIEAVLWLKSRNVTVVAMETTNKSRSYIEHRFEKATALVLGSEVSGVSLQVMELCDDVIEIPTLGRKNSLNVASAGAVVVFEALRQFGIHASIPCHTPD